MRWTALAVSVGRTLNVFGEVAVVREIRPTNDDIPARLALYDRFGFSNLRSPDYVPTCAKNSLEDPRWGAFVRSFGSG